jgi:LDH2 family malate/lactate/ureidoglycolate dehydrogenase
VSPELRLTYHQLLDVIDVSLAMVGIPAAVREVEAEVTAEADLLGVPSHGISLVPPLMAAIRSGTIKAVPQPHLLRDVGATCVADVDGGPGRHGALWAMERAMERAGRHGIGLCLATNVAHWGRGHAYAYRAALAGMVGICTTNAMTNMLGFGSSRPLLGNNPLAIGVPRGANEDPIVLDMAMSQAAIGKIGTYAREGKPVPEGWGLDTDGQPTNDPARILASHRVLPMGDHKGAGLSLMLELLTGALAGGLLSYEIALGSGGLDTGTTKLFIALDVAAVSERERFAARVTDLLAFLHDNDDAPEGFLYPGERGWRTRERYLAEGIPIHGQIVAQLQAAGVPLPRRD